MIRQSCYVQLINSCKKKKKKTCRNATNCFGKAEGDSRKSETKTYCTSDLMRWIKTSDPMTPTKQKQKRLVSNYYIHWFQTRVFPIHRVVPHQMRSLNFTLETHCENIRARACFTVCDGLAPVCSVCEVTGNHTE